MLFLSSYLRKYRTIDKDVYQCVSIISITHPCDVLMINYTLQKILQIVETQLPLEYE